MKKILFISLASVMLASCSLYKMSAVQTSSALDYSLYQKEGLFLTESNSVSFNYEPIASVSALQLSGYLPSGKAPKQYNEDLYGTTFSEPQRLGNEWLKATRESVLAELCKKAKEKGATGIINIQIKYTSVPVGDKTYQSGYEATGMAIKK